MAKSESTWRNRLRYVLLFSVFAILLVNAVFFLQPNLSASLTPEEKKAAPPMPPMTVEVTPVTITASSHEITTVGTLDANESVIIRSEVSGRISDIKFNEGEKTEKDTILFSLDQSVLQAELEKAKADLDLHYADYKRAKALLKDNAISVRERDQAYAQWKLDQANVKVIEAQLNKTIIRAPFNGKLGLRKVSTGDFINAGQDLINLEDISKLKVEFKIPEIHSALVNENQKVMLRSDAFPDKVFEAVVYAVNPRIDSNGRSLVVRAAMDNPEQKLRPGQFVRVALIVGERKNTIFIPEQAVIPQPKRKFVWKILEGKAAMVEITTGQRNDGMVEITKGLNPEDIVITGGIQKIGQGMPVNAVKADPDMFVNS